MSTSEIEIMFHQRWHLTAQDYPSYHPHTLAQSRQDLLHPSISTDAGSLDPPRLLAGQKSNNIGNILRSPKTLLSSRLIHHRLQILRRNNIPRRTESVRVRRPDRDARERGTRGHPKRTGKRPRDALEGGLCRAVHERGRGVGQPGRGAGDVDDPAAPGREVRHAFPRERHGAVHVAVHEVQEDVGGRLVDGPVVLHPADAGVVDEYVDGWGVQALEGLLDDEGAELGVCDLRLDGDGLADAEAAALVERCFGCFTVGCICDGNFVEPLSRKLDGDGATYAS